MIKNLYLNKQKIYYKTIKFDKFIIIYFFIFNNLCQKKLIQIIRNNIIIKIYIYIKKIKRDVKN